VYCLGYGLDDPGSSPGRDKRLRFLQSAQPGCGTYRVLNLRGTEDTAAGA